MLLKLLAKLEPFVEDDEFVVAEPDDVELDEDELDDELVEADKVYCFVLPFVFVTVIVYNPLLPGETVAVLPLGP